MNKSGLIAELANDQGLNEKHATEIVNLIFDGFTNELKNGDRIDIRGFGTFPVRKYGGYTGRNPKTGKVMKVGEKKFPHFRVGSNLKKLVGAA